VTYQAEDLGLMLEDFGEPCVAGATTFKGMLNEPDEIMNLTQADVMSRQYQLAYITTAATLKRGDSVTVSGRPFTVREAPRQVGDGGFSTVLLSKA